MKISELFRNAFGTLAVALIAIGIGSIVHAYRTESNMTPAEKHATEIRWYVNELSPKLKAGDMIAFKDRTVWLVTSFTNNICEMRGRDGFVQMNITNLAEVFSEYGDSLIWDSSYGHMCAKFTRQFLPKANAVAP